MDIQDYSPAHDARRFQAGTPPIPSIYAGIAGIGLMQEIGIAETRAHVLQLNETLFAGVDELGGTVVTPRDPASHGALVAIRSTDEHALVAALAEEGLLTSSRDGNLRVSAHCYNTHEDIEQLLAGLARHRALAATSSRSSAPTATGWFADAERVRDGHPGLLARPGRPALPGRHAADPEHLRGHRGHRADEGDWHRRHARARRRPQRDADRGVDELGGSIATPRDPAARGALVAIRSSDEHALVAALAAERILTSSRDGNLRISAHCYNTHEDIAQALAGLQRHRDLLA